MPIVDLKRLFPNVRPDPDETLVYWVRSKSNPGIERRVDMTAYCGHGACGCPRFEIKLMGKLERGAWPTEELECRHLRIVSRYMRFQLAGEVIKRKEAAANANKQRYQKPKSTVDHYAKPATVPQPAEVAEPTW